MFCCHPLQGNQAPRVELAFSFLLVSFMDYRINVFREN